MMSAAVFLKLLTCVESLLLGIWTLKRDPESKRSLFFSAYLFVVAAQCFVEYEALRSVSPAQYLAWQHADIFTFVAIALMFHFAVEYAGIRTLKRPIYLWIIYGILCASTIAASTVGVAPAAMPTPDGYIDVHSSVSKLVYILNVFVGISFALGTVTLFIYRLVRATDQRTRRQSVIMLCCMAFLVVQGIAIEVLALFGIRSSLSLSAVSGFLLVNPVLAAAMFRYDILDITPHAAAGKILATMSDGAVLADAEGIVRFSNPAMSALFSIEEPFIIGRKLNDLPWGFTEIDAADAALSPVPFEIGVTDWEGFTVKPSGKRVPVSISSTTVVQKGKVSGYIVILRDVSQRKEIEDVKNSVERMMRHDLNNALTGILAFSDLMCDADNLSAVQHRIMTVIHKSGRMMQSQIEGYLALQRMESGTIDLESLPADVAELARDVVLNLKRLSEARGVAMEIRLNGAPANDKATLSYPTQSALFFGMLLNLAKNAVEASSTGDTVSIDLETEDRKLTVRTHNRGAIPRSIRDRFFGKFVTANKKDGTGLGAYSAKLIAESLGGTINADSDEQNGTTVTVCFSSSNIA